MPKKKRIDVESVAPHNRVIFNSRDFHDASMINPILRINHNTEYSSSNRLFRTRLNTRNKNITAIIMPSTCARHDQTSVSGSIYSLPCNKIARIARQALNG